MFSRPLFIFTSSPSVAVDYVKFSIALFKIEVSICMHAAWHGSLCAGQRESLCVPRCAGPHVLQGESLVSLRQKSSRLVETGDAHVCSYAIKKIFVGVLRNSLGIVCCNLCHMKAEDECHDEISNLSFQFLACSPQGGSRQSMWHHPLRAARPEPADYARCYVQSKCTLGMMSLNTKWINNTFPI